MKSLHLSHPGGLPTADMVYVQFRAVCESDGRVIGVQLGVLICEIDGRFARLMAGC